MNASSYNMTTRRGCVPASNTAYLLPSQINNSSNQTPGFDNMRSTLHQRLLLKHNDFDTTQCGPSFWNVPNYTPATPTFLINDTNFLPSPSQVPVTNGWSDDISLQLTGMRNWRSVDLNGPINYSNSTNLNTDSGGRPQNIDNKFNNVEYHQNFLPRNYNEMDRHANALYTAQYLESTYGNATPNCSNIMLPISASSFPLGNFMSGAKISDCHELGLSMGDNSLGRQTTLFDPLFKREAPYSGYNNSYCITKAETRPSSSTSNLYMEANHRNDFSSLKLGSDKIERTCVVCEDMAYYQHYGVYTCEGCKSFFKRSVQKKISYICQSGKNCVINKVQRNRCQSCRYDKCILTGMDSTLVRKNELQGKRGRLAKKITGGQLDITQAPTSKLVQ